MSNSEVYKIDMDHEGSIKRALIRTGSNIQTLKLEDSQEKFELWLDSIIDTARQCELENTIQDNDANLKLIQNSISGACKDEWKDKSAQIRAHKDKEFKQRVNGIKALYSFMRDYTDRDLMIAVKNIHDQ